ncbi:DNA-binding protein H-NS [Cricetibacter osteomyelitidis]|uniref:DNA-binding protein n=1 Tax=Cricetibacter osteomyelitidis TaxID=1521931 RepID=A0A4R2TS06_9PAST|nr:H-NS family nucleoid-associated regulatory protein [Cricetibacter osteomyelitidis]TCP97832.1 DNA-binding protein H-NS [Cricetibacter osteomyelitidis]
MSDVLKTLSNIRNLRVLARETTLEQLEIALEKFTSVVEEKRQQIQQERQAVKERQERLLKYKELLKQDGVTAEEFYAFLSDVAPKKARKKMAARPAKYQFVTASGETKTWTGQGRTPREIQVALNEGKKLSDFAIK